MEINNEHFLYVEKYRPKHVKDVILPDRIKGIFEKIVKQGDFQHLLLSGTAGTGKTTMAKALCRDVNAEFIIINASENGNIDTIRTDIRSFLSQRSLDGDVKKVVILDEADGLTGVAQQALRNFMEEFSKWARFILTANFSNRIIEPLRSRCSTIEFTFNKKERLETSVKLMKRILFILENEGVEYDKVVVGELVKKYFPDMRKILNEVQSNIVDGKLDKKVLSSFSNSDIQNIMGWLKDNDFASLREWVAVNSDISFNELIRNMYPVLKDHLEPASIPSAILLMNKYDYQNGLVSDKEINTMAFFTEMMVECIWQN